MRDASGHAIRGRNSEIARQLYNRGENPAYAKIYAKKYNETYVTNEAYGSKIKTDYEVELLKGWTSNARSWLDVACGTGYFLANSRGNPDLKCCGLDFAPAMLQEAREANPDDNSTFVLGDCRDRRPEWEGKWDVVSLMWGSYTLQDSVEEIEEIVENLGCWTAPGGICYMPIWAPELLTELHDEGQLMHNIILTSPDGTSWVDIERDGSLQKGVAVPVPQMVEMFGRIFDDVETFDYPVKTTAVVGLTARKKGSGND